MNVKPAVLALLTCIAAATGASPARADGQVAVRISLVRFFEVETDFSLAVWGDPHVNERSITLSRPATNADDAGAQAAALLTRTRQTVRMLHGATEALSSAKLAIDAGELDEAPAADLAGSLVRALRRYNRLGTRGLGWAGTPLAPLIGAIEDADGELRAMPDVHVRIDVVYFPDHGAPRALELAMTGSVQF